MAHEQLVIAAAVPSGQGLKQLGELALAFGLCALIGSNANGARRRPACAPTRLSASVRRGS